MLTDLCRSQLNDRNNAFPFHDPITGVVDCNVAMTSQAIELYDGTLQLSAHDLRSVTHQASGPTGQVLARRAFAFVGMEPLTDYRMLRAVDIETIRETLRAGWFVCLFVDCGVLQATAPELVGDRRYAGAHAVGVFDIWRGSGGVSVHLANPLFDGRRRGAWTAPKGVQVAKLALLRDAAYGYTGGAVVSGWASRPAGGA